jgi:hypothetical protein
MNGLALLGLLLIIYAGVVVFMAAKKPPTIWDMGKIKFFRKILGEKGTVVLFYVIAAVAAGFGIWLLVK